MVAKISTRSRNRNCLNQGSQFGLGAKEGGTPIPFLFLLHKLRIQILEPGVVNKHGSETETTTNILK